MNGQTNVVHQESTNRRTRMEEKIEVRSDASRTLEVLVQRNVARLRVKAGLTQEAMAKKVGISVSYVSMLERGRRRPTLATIAEFAAAFGITPDRLLRK